MTAVAVMVAVGLLRQPSYSVKACLGLQLILLYKDGSKGIPVSLSRPMCKIKALRSLATARQCLSPALSEH